MSYRTPLTLTTPCRTNNQEHNEGQCCTPAQKRNHRHYHYGTKLSIPHNGPDGVAVWCSSVLALEAHVGKKDDR